MSTLASYKTGQHGLFPLDPFRKRRIESHVSAVIRLVSIGNTNRRTTARSQTPFDSLPGLRVKHFPHHSLVRIPAASRRRLYCEFRWLGNLRSKLDPGPGNSARIRQTAAIDESF